MSIKNAVKGFVREYYHITYLPKRNVIFFEDSNEGMICESSPNFIPIGNFKGNSIFDKIDVNGNLNINGKNIN